MAGNLKLIQLIQIRSNQVQIVKDKSNVLLILGASHALYRFTGKERLESSDCRIDERQAT